MHILTNSMAPSVSRTAGAKGTRVNRPRCKSRSGRQRSRHCWRRGPRQGSYHAIPSRPGAGLDADELHARGVRLAQAGLQRFPADRFSSVQRYVKIAATLGSKGVRDVALRVRWMSRNSQPSGKKKARAAGRELCLSRDYS